MQPALESRSCYPPKTITTKIVLRNGWSRPTAYKILLKISTPIDSSSISSPRCSSCSCWTATQTRDAQCSEKMCSARRATPSHMGRLLARSRLIINFKSSSNVPAHRLEMSGGIGLEPRGFYPVRPLWLFLADLPKSQAPPFLFWWRRLLTPAFNTRSLSSLCVCHCAPPSRLSPSLLGVLRAHGRSSDRPIGL